MTTLGLAAFAVGGQSVLVGNRAARAQAELGAERVVPVSPEVADPVAAVRRADPDGTWAMAAATWLPDGGLSVTGTVLGVDAARLAAVGLPVRGGPDPAALARLVDASGAPELRVTGDRLIATLSTAALTGDRAPEVLLVVRTAAGQVVRSEAGALHAGTADYTASVPCDRGCTFVGFVWTRSVLAEQPAGATVALRGLAAERDGRRTALPVRRTDPQAWRAAPPVSESSDAVVVDAAGVRDRFRTASGEAGLTYAATTVPAPAVVTRRGVVPAQPDEGWRVVDQDLRALPFRPVRTVAVLPAVLDDGVLMDVVALHRELPDFDASAHWQVWLSRSAPADAVQRLDRVGLVPARPVSVAQRESTLAREGPALAFSLLLALAVVAAVLAVLATAVSSGAGARGRSRESAAMRLIGVPPRTVLVAAIAEQVVLLGVAALLALPAGTAAVLLVLPLVRQSASSTPVPLVDVPSAAPLLLLLLAYAVVVAAMGAATARSVVRAGAPARLREVDG